MSHLEALCRVSFDPSLFARAARQRLRRTVAYLLLLVVVAATATTISWTMKLREVARRIAPHLDAIPTIRIRAGEASADVEQPWRRRLGRDDHGRDIVVLIDTTGERRGFLPSEVGVFLKRTELAWKTPDGDEHAVSLARVPDVTIGPEVAKRFVARALAEAPFYIAAATLLFYLFAKTVQALFLTLFALIGSARRPAGFGALFSVAVYALTPAVLFDAARLFVPVRVPMPLLLYFLLAAGYAVVGGRHAEPPDDAPETADETPNVI